MAINLWQFISYYKNESLRGIQTRIDTPEERAAICPLELHGWLQGEHFGGQFNFANDPSTINIHYLCTLDNRVIQYTLYNNIVAQRRRERERKSEIQKWKVGIRTALRRRAHRNGILLS